MENPLLNSSESGRYCDIHDYRAPKQEFGPQYVPTVGYSPLNLCLNMLSLPLYGRQLSFTLNSSRPCYIDARIIEDAIQPLLSKNVSIQELSFSNIDSVHADGEVILSSFDVSLIHRTITVPYPRSKSTFTIQLFPPKPRNKLHITFKVPVTRKAAQAWIFMEIFRIFGFCSNPQVRALWAANLNRFLSTVPKAELPQFETGFNPVAVDLEFLQEYPRLFKSSLQDINSFSLNQEMSSTGFGQPQSDPYKQQAPYSNIPSLSHSNRSYSFSGSNSVVDAQANPCLAPAAQSASLSTSSSFTHFLGADQVSVPYSYHQLPGEVSHIPSAFHAAHIGSSLAAGSFTADNDVGFPVSDDCTQSMMSHNSISCSFDSSGQSPSSMSVEEESGCCGRLPYPNGHMFPSTDSADFDDYLNPPVNANPCVYHHSYGDPGCAQPVRSCGPQFMVGVPTNVSIVNHSTPQRGSFSPRYSSVPPRTGLQVAQSSSPSQEKVSDALEQSSIPLPGEVHPQGSQYASRPQRDFQSRREGQFSDYQQPFAMNQGSSGNARHSRPRQGPCCNGGSESDGAYFVSKNRYIPSLSSLRDAPQNPRQPNLGVFSPRPDLWPIVYQRFLSDGSPFSSNTPSMVFSHIKGNEIVNPIDVCQFLMIRICRIDTPSPQQCFVEFESNEAAELFIKFCKPCSLIDKVEISKANVSALEKHFQNPRVYINNLPSRVFSKLNREKASNLLKEVFQVFGLIVGEPDVQYNSSKDCWYAFVLYSSYKEAQQCVRFTNGINWEGHVLTVNPRESSYSSKSSSYRRKH